MDKNELVKLGAKIVFNEIPIIGSVYGEIMSYFDQQKIIDRLAKLEEESKLQHLELEDMHRIISLLSEHEYYIVRNHLRNIIVNSAPEVVDTYNRALVKYLINTNERGINEEVNEIITHLNANDLKTLWRIKGFVESNYIQQSKIDFLKQQHDGDYDVIDIDTKYIIFTKDYRDFYNEDIKNDLGLILGKPLEYLSDKEMNLVYEARSLVKLQNVGAITLKYAFTFGGLSTLDIARIQVTVFGKKILEYLV